MGRRPEAMDHQRGAGSPATCSIHCRSIDATFLQFGHPVGTVHDGQKGKACILPPCPIIGFVANLAYLFSGETTVV